MVRERFLMSRSTDGQNKHEDQLTTGQEHTVTGHVPGLGECSKCQALEARIAELESMIPERADSVLRGPKLPRLEFKALRLIPWGWGEGWQLRPSPPRRHWMDDSPHAYKCLPLVIANQWGWQILCPTKVVVSW